MASPRATGDLSRADSFAAQAQGYIDSTEPNQVSDSDKEQLPTPDRTVEEISLVPARRVRTRGTQLPDSDDEDEAPATTTVSTTSKRGKGATRGGKRGRPSRKFIARDSESSEYESDAPLIPDDPKPSTSKKASKPKVKMGKSEKEHGTRLQGLRWIVYSGRRILNSFAELEEIIAMRVHSQHAMYKAKAKAATTENEGKKLDLQIAESANKRWALLPLEERVNEVKILLKQQEQEVLRLKKVLAVAEGNQAEQERLLEVEKGKTVQAQLDLSAMEEKVLREKRLALNG